MKSSFVGAVALVLMAANGENRRASYPSCDLTAQHASRGEVGGSIKGAGQAHISMRANILQADIGCARRARHLSRHRADALFMRVQMIRAAVDRFVAYQDSLSSAERATYDRQLDVVAMWT